MRSLFTPDTDGGGRIWRAAAWFARRRGPFEQRPMELSLCGGYKRAWKADPVVQHEAAGPAAPHWLCGLPDGGSFVGGLSRLRAI